MKYGKPGPDISDVEVTNVSPHGFWLLAGGEERFVPFADFPWFRSASIGALVKVVSPGPGHLFWPDLDVDIALDSIEHPERYPLVSRVAEPAAPPYSSDGSGRRTEAADEGKSG